jgi:dipeptidyl aminopeptidase/acylaminoacyl peptidase
LVDLVSSTQVTLRSAPDAGRARTLELAATLYVPQPVARVSGPGLLVGHGAGSRRGRHDGFCREACARGFVVLALDFRGHGDSAGRGDGPLEQDIFAAVDLLRANPRVDPERVCYRGSSMGGFYGLKAAPQARFAALALLCPASEGVILAALDDKEGTGPESGSRSSPEDAPPRWDTAALRSYFHRQDSVRLASKVECPVLLVHARGDEVVPLAHSLRLCRHLRTETTLLALEEGTHTSAQHDPRIHHYTSTWLLEKAARKPVSAHTERT